MKKYFLFCIITFSGLFIFINSLFADGTATVNGVNITIIEDETLYTLRVERLNAYALGTSGTYIYNNSGGTSSTAGSVYVLPYEFKSASINITNTAADTITVRPEYQVGTTSFWINGSTTTFVGTQTGFLTITNPMTNLRWGLIKNGTNSAIVTFFEEYTRYIRR